MNIANLLHKYFEGQTSRKEELLLRQYFTQREIPAQWECYRPLFAYLDEERDINKHSRFMGKNRKYIYYTVGSIAACLFLAINMLYNGTGFSEHKNYVIIDGHRYTDEYLIREKASDAFEDVAFDEPDSFSLLFNE